MIIYFLQQLNHYNALLVLAGASLIIISSPFFTLFDKTNREYQTVLDNLSMEGSQMSMTLKTSELLRTSHSCCFAVVLPMTVDILMDLYLKIKGMPIASHLYDRCCLLLFFVVPSILYLCFGQSLYFPGIYVALFYAQYLVMATISCKTVLVEYMEKSPVILPCSLYLALITHCLSSCIRCLEHLYSLSFGVAGLLLSSITFVITVFSLIYWSHITRQRQYRRNCFIPSDEEYYNWIFMLALVASSSWALAAGYFWPTNNWREISDSLLVAYTYIQLGFIVIVTVLPGRIVRMKAILTSEMLSLKQIFVRYVSHEIRSPLNVVHAGLELVLLDLRQADEELGHRLRDAVELVEDIFTASDSAITILNDLLNYEHLDSGNFKLDMSYKPLLRIFENKLKCAGLMAKQKGMDFSVVDETNSTEAGLLQGALRWTTPASEDLEMNSPEVLVTKVVPVAFTFLSDATIVGAHLLIDSGKIDQVLQNLLTNAFKFTPAKKSVKVHISCRPLVAGFVSLPSVTPVVGYLRVEVTDTGAGIAKEHQESVFGEFAQFNRNKLQGGGGSGLGLWISRRIIDLHQGRMGFSSEGLGCGCSFFFELPLYSHPVVSPDELDLSLIEPGRSSSTVTKLLVRDATEGDESTFFDSVKLCDAPVFQFQSDKHGSQSEVREASNNVVFDHVFQQMLQPRLSSVSKVFPADGGRKTGINILVVDDSHLNRKIVRKILESAVDMFPELIITEADDGLSAVKEVKQQGAMGVKFDFILMDFIMTTMNGPEATAILRDSLHYKGVIIGITGNALPTDIDTFLMSGADEVLIKPLTRRKLLDPIQSYLLLKL
mmetsp:Transcript_30767/g.42093  ORF Transcript_30767/g.42093 Transcript_30767/m.42093 type:complete len:831 (+) Transcript_30767:70-2562(+)